MGKIHVGAKSFVLALCSVLVGLLVVLPCAASAEGCSDAAFRLGPSANLPDCRAYEMVTPSYKNSGQVNVLAVSPDGSSLLTGSLAAFAGQESDPGTPSVYSMRRTKSGWATVPLSPPASEYIPFRINGETDFSFTNPMGARTTLWFERGVLQPENEIDLYMRRADGSIVDVGPGLPPSAPAGPPLDEGNAAGFYPAGVSADGSRVLFSLHADFWPGDGTALRGQWPSAGNSEFVSLYEYVGTGNTTPMLVGVGSGGDQISQCGTVLGGGQGQAGTGNGTDSAHNAVSSDDRTVFFTAFPHGYAGCGGSGPPVAELFARVERAPGEYQTIAISEPSKQDCSACDTEASVLADAHFEGASADGSKVFFSTTQPLLGSDTSLNIYEYDFSAPERERIVRVSGGGSAVSQPAAEVTPTASAGNTGSVPRISEDGSHVYFIAGGVLTTDPNPVGQTAQPGAKNVYVFERDEQHPSGRIAFVATLSVADSYLWNRASNGGADLTPDGRFLVFTSERDLTPDDASTARQVFEYDAQTPALMRVSIGQNGFNDNGNVAVVKDSIGNDQNDASIVSPVYGAWDSPSDYWSHLSISADGSYVFFQSPVGLTPQAFNDAVIGYSTGSPIETGFANNVYEYHAGNMYLISDGRDVSGNFGPGSASSSVQLIGGDASGEDVFFATADSLVAQDTDTNVDVYDAHIDGGFPPSSSLSSCLGDACQGQLSGAPTLLSPGSEFQAGGNPPLVVVKAKHKAKKRHRKTRKRRRSEGRRADRAVRSRAHRKAGQS